MTYSLESGVQGFVLPRKYHINQGTSFSLLPGNPHIPSLPSTEFMKKSASYGALPILGIASLVAVSLWNNPASSGPTPTTTRGQAHQAAAILSLPRSSSSPRSSSKGSGSKTATSPSKATASTAGAAASGITTAIPFTGSVGRGAGGGTAMDITPPVSTPPAGTVPTAPTPVDPPAPVTVTPPTASDPGISATVNTPVAQAGVDVIPPALP